MSNFFEAKPGVLANVFQTAQTARRHCGWAFVLTRFLLAIALVSHASRASCQQAYTTPKEIAPEVIAAPPVYLPPVSESPYGAYAPSSVFQDMTTTRPSFSGSLDPIIAKEEGTIINTTTKQPAPSICGTQGWFMQVDSFTWNESYRSLELLEETGPLFSVGYHARKQNNRYRVAIFGGSVNYDGGYFSDNGYESSTSTTDYLGVSCEYDFRWRLPNRPNDAIFVGVGTRLWSRTINDTLTELDDFVVGGRETWWTIYPRVGVDVMRSLGNDWHLYVSGSLGLTAYTSEYVHLFEMTLNPKSGLYGQAEVSLRKNRLFLSLMVEHFSWERTDLDEVIFQPKSTMLTVGMLAGFNF